MSTTTEGTETLERFLTSKQRRNPIVLPQDSSDEELARDWTLSEADKAEVLRCRGEDYRRSFALQLCVLRNYGRFLREYGAVPARIANHLGRQVGLAPVLLFLPPTREATELEHQRRIRDHLGVQPFDSSVETRLKRWVRVRAREGISSLELFRRAEDVLRSWRILLPAPSTIERIVASVSARARHGLFDEVFGRVTPELRRAIDQLLEAPDGDRKSPLFLLKEYPPEASAGAINRFIERYHFLRSIGVGEIDLSGVPSTQVGSLSALARRYDAHSLKRFAEGKRYAMVACFLFEAQRTTLDHVVLMHDQFVTTMSRRSRHSFEDRYRAVRKKAKQGFDILLCAVEVLLDSKRPRSEVLDELYSEIDEHELREAKEACRDLQRLEDRGFVDAFSSRYSHFRRYLPKFLELPFEGEPGAEPLLDALSLVRALDSGEKATLPPETPIRFVPKAWRSALEKDPGSIDRRVWELALAVGVRDALRSGTLYLPESRRHVSFWNLVYDEERWEEEREEAYEELELPTEPDDELARLTQEFDEVARRTQEGLRENDFASIENDSLRLRRQDRLELPERVKKLKQVIETHLPQVRIEDLLMDVDSWCGFTKELRPLGGYEPRSENLDVALFSALIAHGTNLGIAAMGHSVEGMTVDTLQYASRWFLREETLKAANAVLVNYHHELPLSSVWGDGTASSSDGQRFGIQASSLLGSFYPRYFGYYDRAVTIYTHTSDEYSVFGTRPISCAPREAPWVLDGLLENDTVLRPREHYTDTGGYTEHVFGLCDLLGYSFMPRLRDLKDQQIYRVKRDGGYGHLDSLFRGGIDTALIREQWDSLVRVAASLRNRTAPAHVVLKRLSNRASTDRLAKALTMLGRVLKTNYILRYLHEADLRYRVQLQLNRGESRHYLAKRLFFADRGEFRTGDYEEIMNKATCLSLLSNAVVVWNTVRMAKIVEQLREAGEEVFDEDLRHIAPLAHRHVIPNGTYHFGRRRAESAR